MSESGTEAAGATGHVAFGWGTAVIRAVLLLAVVMLAFGLAPNWFLDHLADRLTMAGRDVILVVWWVVALVGCSWLFVALQRRER